MNRLLDLLKEEALRRGLLAPGAALDAPQVFRLVRDMRYHRASNRQPETILAEWQGTCSGKHYLLRDLFAELGLPSTVMACTVAMPVAERDVKPEVRPLWEAANRRFVDVHNYLVVHHPASDTIVDATWPLGMPNRVSNPDFIPGQDQILALPPQQSWPVPSDRDAQQFKQDLLAVHFTPAELEFRELIIAYVSGE
jgi:hypothetical protein